jgi:hypothetical protein
MLCIYAVKLRRYRILRRSKHSASAKRVSSGYAVSTLSLSLHLASSPTHPIPITRMNKWVPLAPNKPGQPSTPSRFNVLKPSKPITRTSQGPFIGRFPEVVVLNIVSFLPIPDLPNIARGNKALARVVRDERGWESRCKLLGLKAKGMSPCCELV